MDNKAMFDAALEKMLGDMDETEGHSAMSHSADECPDPINCRQHDDDSMSALVPKGKPALEIEIEGKPKKFSEGGEAPMDLHLKKGALHEELGVPSGDKIPGKKLDKALDSDSPLERKRAQFAENAKHWNHKAEGGEINADDLKDKDNDGDGLSAEDLELLKKHLR